MKKFIFITLIALLFIGATIYVNYDLAVNAYANGYMDRFIDEHDTTIVTNNKKEFNARLVKMTKRYCNDIGMRYSEERIKNILQLTE